MSCNWTSANMSAVFLEICEKMAGLEKQNEKLLQENNELKDQVSIRKQTRISELEATISKQQETISDLMKQNTHKEGLITGLKAKVIKMDAKIQKYDPSWISNKRNVDNLPPKVYKREKICFFNTTSGGCRNCKDTCSFAHGEEMLGTTYRVDNGKCMTCKIIK